MYRIYLDNNILTDEPDGWVDFTTKINRNFDDRWLLVTYPVDLTFYGDGFTYIYNKFNELGYDVLIDFIAQQLDDTGNEITQTLGSIIMTDVTFDLVKKTATTQIKENSYMSRIFGNRNNPVSLPTAETKNGETIGNPARLNTVNFDGVTSGTILNGATREGMNAYKALQMIVLNMTDNNVTFESDILNTLGDTDLYPRKLMLISGLELRKGNTRGRGDAIIKISFQDLFRDLSRLCNLYLYPDTTEIPPKIVAGSEYDWYSSALSVDFDQPDAMEQTFFQELFYNEVRMGGQAGFSTTDVALNYPRVNFASFKNEEYYFSGVNNIDNELQLTTPTLISDSNIINDVLVNGSEAYDDAIFVVEVDASNNVQGYSIANTTVMNRRLMHDEMLNRYNLANRVTENLTIFDDNYQMEWVAGSDFEQEDVCRVFIPLNTFVTEAIRTQNCYDSQTITLSDRNFTTYPLSDGDVQWSGEKFTAPITGVYGFEFDYAFEAQILRQPVEPNWKVKATLTAVRKSGTTIIEQIPIGDCIMEKYIGVMTDSFSRSVNITLNINETLEFVSTVNTHVVGAVPLGSIWITGEVAPFPKVSYKMTKSQFRLVTQPNISVDIAQPDIQPEQYKGSKVIIETALNQEEIKKMYRHPNYSLQINNFVNQDELKRAWIYSAEINETTGKCSFELITNLAKFDESTLSQRRKGGGIDAPTCQTEILCFANPLNSQYIPLI